VASSLPRPIGLSPVPDQGSKTDEGGSKLA
jgi:hypothetical protein